MRLIIKILVGIFCVAQTGTACDSGWQYIGQSPWLPLSAIFYPNSTDTVLIGTNWNTTIPSSGGVYRHVGADTTMQYAGLINRSVCQLRNYSFFRPDRIFAATSGGVYEFAGDTSWTPLYAANRLVDFDISPLDTNLWIAAGSYSGQGTILVSEDGGNDWYAFYDGFVRGYLLCSRYQVGQVFFADGSTLARVSIPDSTYEIIQNYAPSGPYSVFYHPTQPWIYSTSNRRVGRYNESTGDTMAVAAPDSVDHLTNASYDASNNSLLVGSSAGLYIVSDDLTSWQSAASNRSTLNWHVLAVVDSGCIANGAFAVYSARPTGQTAGQLPHPQKAMPSVVFYPNPFNSSFVLVLAGFAGGDFEIGLYNLLGQQVDVVHRGPLTGGQLHYQAPSWLASGVYLLSARDKHGVQTKKVVLMK